MRTRIIAGISALAILTTACDDDFLNITPPAALTETTFFRTPADAEAASTAAYRPLLNSTNIAKITEAPIDDNIIYNTQGLWLDSWGIAATDPLIDDVWQTQYEGIFRANVVLQKVPGMTIPEAQGNQILGEAHFLRAFYYWQLTTQFGDVPLIVEADPADLSKAKKPKSPVSEIREVMIEDLETAISLLPTRAQQSSANLGRATRGAAQALLGKVYLYAKDYVNAERYLRMVVESGEYTLLPAFSNLLITDNNAESLFEIQFTDLAGLGTSRIVNDYPQGQGGFANILPTQDLVDEFETHTGPTAINGKDPRLFYSIFQEGDPYDAVQPQFRRAWTPSGFARKKGMFPVIRANNSNLGRNFPLIRFADVLLMFAEAANENNKPAEAIAAINRVRQRVGMPPLPTAQYPVANKQQIFQAIVHERRVELAFEYHRLNDLRRWGLAAQELAPFGYVAPKHDFYPIPQAEIDNNPELQQNPNY